MHQKLGIATRFYGLTEGDVQRLATWVDAALAMVPASCVYVAIHAESDLSGSLDFMRKKYPEVRAFPVTPWGKVVQAPNAVLSKSAEQDIKHLLFASTEYPVTKPLVSLLQSHCDARTLVAGARLPSHDCKAPQGGSVLVRGASGMQIPWNTYALWSVEHLVHTGFVLAADSLQDPDNAGMEEMGTIAAQQILWPGNAKALLIAPPAGSLAVNTHGWNINRHERYVHNLESKNSRAAVQLERLSLPTPDVYHIGEAVRQ